MQDQPNNLQEPRRKCPKGMKLPNIIKAQAALMFHKTKSERRHFMRSMGIAIHEAASKVRNAARDAVKSRNAAKVTSDPAVE